MSYSNSKNDHDDCMDLMQRMTNYFIENSDALLTMVHNSGKDYNDFGRYEDCNKLEGFNYLLGSLKSEEKMPIPISIGMCVPAMCKAGDLNEAKNYMLPILNNQIGVIFKGVEGFNISGLVLENKDIHFSDSEDLNDKAPSFGFSNFLMIVLIIGLVTLSIVSSVISH